LRLAAVVAVGCPVAVAVPALVETQNPVVAGEGRRHLVPAVRRLRDAVQAEQGRRGRGAPLDVMKTQTARRDPPAVCCGPVCRERAEHETRGRWLRDQLAQVGGTVCLADEPAYPARLRGRLDPLPAVIYGFGAFNVLPQRTLAVLNSRTVSEHFVSASLAAV